MSLWSAPLFCICIIFLHTIISQPIYNTLFLLSFVAFLLSFNQHSRLQRHFVVLCNTHTHARAHTHTHAHIYTHTHRHTIEALIRQSTVPFTHSTINGSKYG